jgi:hypothetical protein
MVLTKRLVPGVLLVLTGTLAATAPLAITATPAAAATTTAPDAATLYREAIATTHDWSVHYASASKVSGTTILVSGDTGPASGTQLVQMGKASLTDNATIVVIGGITYLKGNASGLTDLAGIDSSQAALAAGHWIKFATTNGSFTQVVAGVRSHDVAQELALKGPYSLGTPRSLQGQEVDAIDGTQTLSGKTPVRVVLYVRAKGSHVPVEEDTVGADGKPTGAEHIVYSSWGEQVRPQAPQATLSVGSISSV